VTAPTPFPTDPDWEPRPHTPPDLSEAQTALHGDRLGAPRPCRTCGRPIRQAAEKGRRSCNLVLDVEGPYDPPTVPYPQVHGIWWHHRHGLSDRIPRGDQRHQAEGAHLFVLHTHPKPPAPPTEGTPRTMTAPFGTARPPGDGVKNEDLEGKLLLLKVTEKRLGVVTTSGAADVVVADVTDLESGEEHPGNFLFGKVLFGQLETGTTYLGRIGKGVAQPGKSAPWLWTDAADADSVAKANQYLAWKAQQNPASPSTPAPAATPAAAPAATAAAPPWAA
jgi:hypothetical protein